MRYESNVMRTFRVLKRIINVDVEIAWVDQHLEGGRRRRFDGRYWVCVWNGGVEVKDARLAVDCELLDELLAGVGSSHLRWRFVKFHIASKKICHWKKRLSFPLPIGKALHKPDVRDWSTTRKHGNHRARASRELTVNLYYINENLNHAIDAYHGNFRWSIRLFSS